MLAEQVRSGLVETRHDGAVAVIGSDGALLSSHGDIDTPFFIRSSAKPFQAVISQEAGANLQPLQLAMACASHRGFPVHIALVGDMLESVGLGEDDLGCPPDFPLADEAFHLIVGRGDAPRRIWHNCSGKHAAFLRACVASDWPTESYLDPKHPLQQRVIDFLSELSPTPVTPVGVDGCGAPVVRTTVRSLATMYARLATDERLAGPFDVMRSYPALVGVNGEGDTDIAIAVNGAAKGGAAGCVGVALEGGVGIAAKSWDGLSLVANLAAANALRQVVGISNAVEEVLQPVLRPVALGGGKPVGHWEPRFEL